MLHEIVQTFCAIIRDGVTWQEVSIVALLCATTVLCVWAISAASAAVIEYTTNGILGIFGTSVTAISNGIRRAGGNMSKLFSSGDTGNGPPKKTY